MDGVLGEALPSSMQFDLSNSTMTQPPTFPRVLDFKHSVQSFHNFGKTHPFKGWKGGEGPVEVIDPFEGRIPLVKDRDTFNRGGFRESIVRPAFLLDSCLAGALKSLVDRVDSHSSRTDEATLEWLKWATKLGWDYNPVFYLFESLSNGYTEKERICVVSTAAAILRLHAMDEPVFLSSGRILERPEARAHYLEQSGASDYEELAHWQLATMESQWSKGAGIIEEMRLRSYVCLLKMVLLRPFHSPADPLSPIRDFAQFLLEKLGIWMGREYALACYWFGKMNQAHALLKVQEKSDTPASAKSKLMGCAMDLQFIRFPEFLLWSTIEEEMNLGVLTTKDIGLGAMAALFTLEELSGSEGDLYPYSKVRPLFDPLARKFTVEKVATLDPWNPRFFLGEEVDRKRSPISSQDLGFLIEELEIQLNYMLFKNGSTK